MLGILSGVLAGFFTFFLTGTVQASLNFPFSKQVQVSIQATGGIAVAVLTVAYWQSSAFPIQQLGQLQDQAYHAALNQSGQQLVTTPQAPTGGSTPGNTAPVVHVPSTLRKLAADLFKSDPTKFSALGSLANSATVPTSTYSAAISTLAPAQEAPSNAQLLQSRFGKGLGPYNFGMTPANVNALLPHPFADSTLSSLPIASEYKSSEVRYFWVPLQQFPAGPPNDLLYTALSEFHACWSGQSYITFLFANSHLVHISVRLYSDCVGRTQVLQQLAVNNSIQDFNSLGPLVFQAKLNGVTVAGYTGAETTSLEIFTNDSPQS